MTVPALQGKIAEKESPDKLSPSAQTKSKTVPKPVAKTETILPAQSKTDMRIIKLNPSKVSLQPSVPPTQKISTATTTVPIQQSNSEHATAARKQT